jgi:hypothetical protein
MSRKIFMQAYTYSIKHIPSKSIYYGVRKASEIDLGITYFSSSKLVKRLISQGRRSDFEFKVRRTFPSYEEARLHENKILTRINAVTNPNVLNQAISSARICSKDSASESRRRHAISIRMKELWATNEYRNGQTFNKLTHDERVERGKSGAKKRAKNYANGITQRKIKKTPVYKDVHISRNGIIKVVKSNQVPAYKAIGWIKL